MKITGSTPVYALLGQPVGHSLSPVMQNQWIDEHGFDGVYVALGASETGFEIALAGLFEAGLMGANITTPFKERASAALSTVSPQARAIQSVNCLKRGADGFVGESTDGDGLIADLDVRAPHWRVGKGHVVLLGAGGAARSILYALAQAGITDIRLINRDQDRAANTASVAPQVHTKIAHWDKVLEHFEGACLIINATSAGLNDQNPLRLDFSRTAQECVVYDTIYAPRTTQFLRDARGAGKVGLDGLGMLVGQGALSFQHWFGVLPDQASGMAILNQKLSS